MYYCMISLCANLGKNSIKNGILCSVYESLDEVRQELEGMWFLDPLPEDEWNTIDCHTMSNNKILYIEHVMNTIKTQINKVLVFNRLMSNHSCCELYMYCHNKPNKIKTDKNGYVNVILTDNEIKELFSPHN